MIIGLIHADGHKHDLGTFKGQTALETERGFVVQDIVRLLDFSRYSRL